MKTYKSFYVLAVDRSEIRFDRTIKTETLFGKRSNDVASKCRTKISTLTYVISGFLVVARIDSIHSSERTLAKGHFSEFEKFCIAKNILIFDRGYPSKEMVAKLTKMGCKYLMRVQKSSFKEINEVKADDCYINILYDDKLYKIRFIRFLPPSGETEVLITNLGRKSFKKCDFMKFYGLRWGIEIKYNTIKNKILVERFSGKGALSIKQEFFAALFISNCSAAISLSIEGKISLQKQNCKYDYKPNMNLIIGYLKHRFPRILLSTTFKTIFYLCGEILCLALKQPVPIKPSRHL